MGAVDVAVVLTGGFATRLRPLTLTRPKALLPILGRPLLDWIIEGLARAGVKKVILSVRYLADLIRGRYGRGDSLGVGLEYAEELKPLGDAGPIPVISRDYGLDNTFLVVYGDVFSDINYGDVLDFHRRVGGLATMVLTRVEDPSRYGVSVLDDGFRVVSFVEKPGRGEAMSNLVNAGVYVFEPEALKYFPPKTPSKLSRDVIPRMVREGVIYGYVHEGIWSDIGVPKDYMRANFNALDRYFPSGYVSREAEVGRGVELVNPVFIEGGVKVGEGSVVGPYAVIGRNARIGSSVRVSNSIILESVVIDGSTLIEGSIVGRGSYIGKWVRISSNSVLGDEVVLSSEVFIARNVIILPYKEVGNSVFREGSVIL